MNRMFTIKNTKSGKIALIFDENNADFAYQVAQLYLQGLASSVKESGDSLSAIKKRVEGFKPCQHKTNIALSLKSPMPVDLHEESEGDVILRIIFEKINDKYDSDAPVYCNTFYNALEKECGIDLKQVHRERTAGKDTRRYPNRKIDSVLSVLDAKYVLEFAKNYEFPEKKTPVIRMVK